MKKLLIGGLLAIAGIPLKSQTLTGTITTQPCTNNGVCSVTVTGMSLPIDYTYYINGSTVVHSGVFAFTDQLNGFTAGNSPFIYCQASNGTLTAGSSFSYTSSFNVTVNNSPAICPSTTGTLTGSAAGSPGPYNYVWTNISTSLNYTGNPLLAPVGTYSLLVTDQTTGCFVQLADSASTIFQQSNVHATSTTTLANCTNGAASISATGGVPPYSYQWNTGANTASVINLVQGVYTATVTDSQGCADFSYAYVQQAININVNPSITNATCIQTNGGAIAFASGGVPPYSYLWSNGQSTQTLTSVSGGTYYTVVATDANGCTGLGYASIGATTPVSVTYTASASSCTASTGSASLTIAGGTPPYTVTWNTFPVVSGTSLVNFPSGNYAFTVTDAVGCVRTGYAYIPPISSIHANLVASSVICPANTGTITANVSGTNPPFTYVWSNTSTASHIDHVSLGNYSCIIKDALGCSVTKSTNLTALSPVHVGLIPTQASCQFVLDGSVTANATGGTAPYTYSWGNGQTGVTASGLPTGNISVNATDANGCSAFAYTQVGYNAANTSCYCTITGNVFRDMNSNCIKDAGETGIQNSMIHCSGFGYAFTDASGNYSFQVPSGTYTLSESVNSSYPLSPCQSNAQVQVITAASGCVTTVNFANNVIVLHDVHIITTSNFSPGPVPGNPYHQKVIILNDGTVSESGIQIGYTTDGQIGGFTASPAFFTQQDAITYPNWYSVQSGFGTLSPGASRDIDLTYNVPTNIPLGTMVGFYDTTSYMAPMSTTWLTDQTPWNNVNTYQQVVIGSFDPNFKEVSPKGSGPQGYIATKDSLLTYVIHFQNEGTYYAQNISVVDTLDSDLDWTTLRPGYSDHSYVTSVSESGVVTFKFANINLAWKSQYGDFMSSGMVTYTIKRKRNLAQGTQIENKAAIYFDYNAPVITNTTLNTLNDLVVSVNEKGELHPDEVTLYPNPASEELHMAIQLKGTGGKGQVTVLDLTGKVRISSEVNLETGSNLLHENIGELPSGIYFVQVKHRDLLITKKLVVIK